MYTVKGHPAERKWLDFRPPSLRGTNHQLVRTEAHHCFSDGSSVGSQQQFFTAAAPPFFWYRSKQVSLRSTEKQANTDKIVYHPCTQVPAFGEIFFVRQPICHARHRWWWCRHRQVSEIQQLKGTYSSRKPSVRR